WWRSVEDFHHPEAQVVATASRGRIRCTTAGGTLHVGVAGVGTGAEHAYRAVAALVGAAVHRCLAEILLEAVLGPLEDIAVHVVQAPGIRREGGYRRGFIHPLVTALDVAAKALLALAEVAEIGRASCREGGGVASGGAPWTRR